MPPIYKAFGSGGIGPKSAHLIADSKAAEKAGLYILPSVSYTSQFFRAFLERSGAFEAKSSQEAQERIYKTEFNQQELKAVAEGVMFLCEDKWRSLIVRSDESADGIGLWKSKVAPNLDDPDYLYNYVLRNIKEVLASDFSEPAQEFKRLKGMVGSPGILLMPAIGRGTMGEPTPIFSCNCMGRINDWWLAAIFDGAASNYPKSVIRTKDADFNTNFEMWGENNISFGNWICNLKKAGAYDQLKYLLKTLDVFNSETGPGYRELVAGPDVPPEFYLVQSSPVSIQPISPPKYSRLIGESEETINTGIARTDTIRMMKYDNEGHPTEDNAQYNRENKGYLFFDPSPKHESFTKEWFKYFSNAAAMVVGTRANMVSEHVGAFLRQLGIPIIVCEDSNANKILRHMSWDNSKHNIVVYADEFHPEGSRGFVAVDEPAA